MGRVLVLMRRSVGVAHVPTECRGMSCIKSRPCTNIATLADAQCVGVTRVQALRVLCSSRLSAATTSRAGIVRVGWPDLVMLNREASGVTLDRGQADQADPGSQWRPMKEPRGMACVS